MKKGLFFSAAALLAALFVFAGCDFLPFGTDAGERFETDGLEQVFEAMAAKNYTIEGADGSTCYIMENAIVETFGPTKPGNYSGITRYTYYDTASFWTASDESISVKMRQLYQNGDSSSPNDFHYREDYYNADSIQELYDIIGLAWITTSDWEYDEAEKLYRSDEMPSYEITLQISGARVTMKVKSAFGDDNSASISCVFKNFGVTEYDLSIFYS